ncbi:toll/interleukin-1 receptor domain-containing protein [Demequina mangrovi]|uniref:TIR domain-containing protein n=1 Tax=Demequina mangrovi TaxID=1043493 RepID=A0A1H6X9Q8_9MICO|nr:toll/interleukin-1 receptor domain-containing protein [Demequina mangrovi]SEJ25879.1 TIR domain-containing protein [Demequina mangrovi]
MSEQAQPQSRGTGRRYDVFISYSRKADGQFAPSLQRALARFGRPWHRRRSFEVFRDQTGLSVNPDLEDSIVAALDSSEYFVLLASPMAAGSDWVGKEIRHCLETKGPERLIVVITEGEAEWDHEAGDFTADSTAIHPALRGVLDAEPFLVDLKWAERAADLTSDNSHYRADVARIVSRVTGESVDDAIRRDLAQRRRTRAMVGAAVLLMGIAAAAAVVAALVAQENQRVAAAERDAAEAEARVALGREFAALARGQEDSRAALALAAEAYALAPSAEPAGAMLEIAARADHEGGIDLSAILPAGVGAGMVQGSSATGRLVVSTGGGAMVMDAVTGETWTALEEGIALSPDGTVALGPSGTVVHLEDGGAVTAGAQLPPPVSEVAFAESAGSAAYLADGPDGPDVVLADLASGGERRAPLDAYVDLWCPECMAIDVTADAESVAVRVSGSSTYAGAGATVLAFASAADALTEVMRRESTAIGTARFNDDDTELWVRDGAEILVLDPRTLEEEGDAMQISSPGPLVFLSDEFALTRALACEPPALLSVPTMSRVASLPVDGPPPTEGVGCQNESGAGAVVTGLEAGRYILSELGVWPVRGEDLEGYVCTALGSVPTSAEYEAWTGLAHTPVACGAEGAA